MLKNFRLLLFFVCVFFSSKKNPFPGKGLFSNITYESIIILFVCIKI